MLAADIGQADEVRHGLDRQERGELAHRVEPATPGERAHAGDDHLLELRPRRLERRGCERPHHARAQPPVEIAVAADHAKAAARVERRAEADTLAADQHIRRLHVGEAAGCVDVGVHQPRDRACVAQLAIALEWIAQAPGREQVEVQQRRLAFRDVDHMTSPSSLSRAPAR